MIVFDTSIYIDALIPIKEKRKALDIAFETHRRAIDSYFIATSKKTNSILLSNDRIMVNNEKNWDQFLLGHSITPL